MALNVKYVSLVMLTVAFTAALSTVYVYNYSRNQIGGLETTVSALQDNLNEYMGELDKLRSEVNQYQIELESQLEAAQSTLEQTQSQLEATQSELQKYKELTLVDDEGYVLKLTSYPEKIVSLSPTNTEILFSVGAGNKMVGVTSYCNYPHEVLDRVQQGNLTVIGGFYDFQIETVVSLDPDLIFGSTVNEEGVQNLRGLGYDVLVLEPNNIDEVLKDILLVGRATDQNNEAGILVSDLRRRIDDVLNKVAGAISQPKVYHEVWSDPLYTAGPDTWISKLIEKAGGVNIFADAQTDWPIISSESVIERNPEIMMFPHQHGERFWGTFEDVKARPGWLVIDAVKNDRLYEIEGDLISRAGPRVVEALERIVEIIHPDLS